MSCSHRSNKMMRDISRVRILAQAVADLTQAEQIIYKTICDGVQVFKFSTDWKGPGVETVRPHREYTSKNILSSSEHSELEFIESEKLSYKERPAPVYLGQISRPILSEEQYEVLQQLPKRGKGKRRVKK